MQGMTTHQAKRLRNLINGLARLLDGETDPAKILELKTGIQAAEAKLSGTSRTGLRHFDTVARNHGIVATLGSK